MVSFRRGGDEPLAGLSHTSKTVKDWLLNDCKELMFIMRLFAIAIKQRIVAAIRITYAYLDWLANTYSDLPLDDLLRFCERFITCTLYGVRD